ncbi:hypothetical protein [Asticcacaulis sp. AC402]|uniref:hypothetical protein n=1 Tax=Asticcacaulis sp. AC402 TaxID=1282361 RepID=UPI0003C3BDB1|nr:hypothetical protein [Asticcacaulis sp. AC402]ESQ75149.1 hypothetical protein ABAC402_10800 [Asticcacaulis sp. AC402]
MKLLPLLLIASLAGCATASHDERALLLAQNIDCAKADEQITALKAAMPSRGERAKSVLQTATPIGAVVGAAKGAYKDNAQILSGRTQSELEARITDIEIQCQTKDAIQTSQNAEGLPS